ncbi:Rpn family recombination-promoting nuclease/putative transposase [Alcaligenaceae bacterium]|nr:Rpn family recombination-promoting nuclease/putative transposase [Alcaligenaceae bacterium]
MNLHDQHYRKLFSSPRMVRALFEGILPASWRAQLDLDTLEPLPPNFVSSRNRDRRADGVWRVRRRDGDMLYLLILLEHQSGQDYIMSIRCMGYVALLYEDLVMRQMIEPSRPLPAILPIVIYSGASRWRSPLQVSELLEPAPRGLEPYQPHMRYLVLDTGALVERGSLPAKNLAALMFRLEHNQGLEHSQEILQTILRLSRGPKLRELRRAVFLWVRHVLLPRSLPRTIDLPAVNDLREITIMLTTHSKDWSQRWRQEGHQEGHREGASSVLEHQLSRKFGPLSPEIIARLRQADTAQLQAWSLNLLDATTLDQVFTQ